MNINLTLIGQMGTFLVFWWFINKIIWPIFSRIAKERQQRIADGLNMADKARFTVQEAQSRSEEMVDEAKTQASEILARANKQAADLIDKARIDAQRAGELEITQAKAQIEQEKRQIQQQLKMQLTELVVEGAQKIVGREVNQKDHEQLLRELSEKF